MNKLCWLSLQPWLLAFWCSAAVYIQLEILKVWLFIVTKSLLYWTESIRTSWLLWKMCCVCSSLNPNTTHCVVGVSSHERVGLWEAPPPSGLVDRVCDRLLPLTEVLSLAQLCGCIVFSTPLPGSFHSAARGGECVWSHLFWSRSGARGGGPHQHGPAPDSQQRRPVSCDALLGLHWRIA